MQTPRPLPNQRLSNESRNEYKTVFAPYAQRPKGTEVMAVEKKKTTHSYYPTQVGKKETIKVCKTSINLELSMKNYLKKKPRVATKKKL